MKTSARQIFSRIFSRNVKKPIITTKTVAIAHEEEKKKLGKGRAFQNRKTTKGRRSQYIPMYTDSMGNVHHKLVCHSY
jgi:hypothetical protein